MALGFASFADLSFGAAGDTENYVVVTGNGLTASVGDVITKGFVDVVANGSQVTTAVAQQQ